MNKLRNFGYAIAAVVATIVLAASAYAQNTNSGPGPFMGRGGPPPGGRFGGPGGRGPGGPLGPLGPMIERLNLTDAQKDQVKTIVEAHREEMRSIGERSRTAHQALETAIAADTFDEATIRARSMEVAAVDADMTVLQARVRSEVFQLLTPEQKAQAKELQAQRPHGRGQRAPQ